MPQRKESGAESCSQCSPVEVIMPKTTVPSSHSYWKVERENRSLTTALEMLVGIS
jgi:hypothetical protein